MQRLYEAVGSSSHADAFFSSRRRVEQVEHPVASKSASFRSNIHIAQRPRARGSLYRSFHGDSSRGRTNLNSSSLAHEEEINATKAATMLRREGSSLRLDHQHEYRQSVSRALGKRPSQVTDEDIEALASDDVEDWGLKDRQLCRYDRPVTVRVDAGLPTLAQEYSAELARKEQAKEQRRVAAKKRAHREKEAEQRERAEQQERRRRNRARAARSRHQQHSFDDDVDMDNASHPEEVSFFDSINLASQQALDDTTSLDSFDDSLLLGDHNESRRRRAPSPPLSPLPMNSSRRSRQW